MELLQSSLTDFQSQMFWLFLFLLPDPRAVGGGGWGVLSWGSGLSYGRTSVIQLFSDLWVTHLEDMGFGYIAVCLSYQSYCGFVFMSLVVEDFCWQVSVFFKDGFYEDCCDFGMFGRA